MGKFYDLMDRELRIRGFAEGTRESYLRSMRCFVRHFMRPPDELTAEDVKQYQLFLTKERRVSWSTFNVQVCAMRFLSYLGRYTHRIAISNERIVAMDGDDVTLSYKDRANGDKRKLMTLSAETFLRRFLLHVLPRGFVRIRHYGLLANAVRQDRIALCRKLLRVIVEPAAPAQREGWQELLLRLTGKDVTHCPSCGLGRLQTTREIEPTICLHRVEQRAASP